MHRLYGLNGLDGKIGQMYWMDRLHVNHLPILPTYLSITYQAINYLTYR